MQMKVAWIHFERSAILTVHTHVITRNPRVTVSHENHKIWWVICFISLWSGRNLKMQFGRFKVFAPVGRAGSRQRPLPVSDQHGTGQNAVRVPQRRR